MYPFPWWTLLAGTALFLFGMHVVEQALNVLAGRPFKVFLRKQTSNTVKSVFSGALVTALLQSSSMVSLMVMSLAGAGIIGLESGIGLILGANLGTTTTGWIISSLGFRYSISDMAYPLLAISGLAGIFLRNEKWQSIAKVLTGLSLMFIGIGWMREAFADVAYFEDQLNWKLSPQFWFVIVGLIIAAALQSSSATVALALTSISTGLIDLQQAMLLVIGADMGTTVTALIATWRANTIKKRVGWSQILFNIFSSGLAWLMLPWYQWLIQSAFGIYDSLVALAFFHTLMNLFGILVMVPMVIPYSKLITHLVPGGTELLSVSIKEADPYEFHSASEAMHAESHKFYERSLSLLRDFFNISNNRSSQHVRTYADLKRYENEIAMFGLKMQRNALNEAEAAELNNITQSVRHTATAVKDVKDILHNIDELRNSASDDLYGFYQTLQKCQEQFYNQLGLTLQKHTDEKSDAMILLKDVAESTHRVASDDVYRLFSGKSHREIMIPSLLNLIRSVNNSNESLLRAMLGDGLLSR
ncbi:MAG: Na/Pi cotransporter family protein [Bacteroidota bacterium]|jgi:phosphate:Na+ symporter